MKRSLFYFFFFLLMYVGASTAEVATDKCIEYVKNSDYRKAVEECSRRIEKGGSDKVLAIYYDSRGLAYFREIQYDKAVADFTKAIELSPESFWLYNNRGLAFFRDRQYDKAIADFSRAADLNPKFFWPFNNRGSAYSITRQHDRAIVDYNRAIELDPNNPVAYANRAIAHARVGQSDLSEDDLVKATALDPKTGAYGRACIFSLGGNPKQACQWLKKAIDLGEDDLVGIKTDPDFDRIRNAACFKKITQMK